MQPLKKPGAHQRVIGPALVQAKPARPIANAQARLQAPPAVQLKRPPVAPPVYRPQQTAKPVQAKMATGALQTRTLAVAPPVYRPNSGHQSVQPLKARRSPLSARPVAPPVYRPQPPPVVLQAMPVGGQRPNPAQSYRSQQQAPVSFVMRGTGANFRKNLLQEQRALPIQLLFPNGTIQRMDSGSDEWLPDEEIKERKKAKKRAERDPEEYYESSDEDADVPDGYMDAHLYNDSLPKLRADLSNYGDAVWVKPVKGQKIAIWFKPEHVEDTKFEKLNGRQESKNEGDVGYTWHHTDHFEKGKCFMQLVPARIHSKISHIGGVGL